MGGNGGRVYVRRGRGCLQQRVACVLFLVARAKSHTQCARRAKGGGQKRSRAFVAMPQTPASHTKRREGLRHLVNPITNLQPEARTGQGLRAERAQDPKQQHHTAQSRGGRPSLLSDVLPQLCRAGARAAGSKCQAGGARAAGAAGRGLGKQTPRVCVRKGRLTQGVRALCVSGRFASPLLPSPPICYP